MKHSKLEIRSLKLKPHSQIIERAKRIKLLLMDCDGVLTDGRIWLTADGEDREVCETILQAQEHA